MGSIQRGGIIRRNDNGTLERVDGTNTYIGSATLPSGRVITKRFRCTGFDEEEVAERWLKWQGKNNKEETMAENKTEVKAETKAKAKKDFELPKCPMSGEDCGWMCPMWSAEHMKCAINLGGIALYNMSTNMMRLDVTEPLELLALAIADNNASVSTPVVEEKEPELTEEGGIEMFLEGKSFIEFVNLSSKAVYAEYKKACGKSGHPAVKETVLVDAVVKKFPELVKKGVRGGSVFKAA